MWMAAEAKQRTCMPEKARRKLLRWPDSAEGAWCRNTSSSSSEASPRGDPGTSAPELRTRNVYARSGSHSTVAARPHQCVALCFIDELLDLSGPQETKDLCIRNLCVLSMPNIRGTTLYVVLTPFKPQDTPGMRWNLHFLLTVERACMHALAFVGQNGTCCAAHEPEDAALPLSGRLIDLRALWQGVPLYEVLQQRLLITASIFLRHRGRNNTSTRRIQKAHIPQEITDDQLMKKLGGEEGSADLQKGRDQVFLVQQSRCEGVRIGLCSGCGRVQLRGRHHKQQIDDFPIQQVRGRTGPTRHCLQHRLSLTSMLSQPILLDAAPAKKFCCFASSQAVCE